jgi:hypothetical protein
VNPKFIKFLFLKELPEEYKLACQTLESQDLSMEAMIMRLTEIEQRLKAAGGKESANSVQGPAPEWLKSAKCYNCGKKGHLAKRCREPKKTDEENDEKTRKMRLWVMRSQRLR